MEKQIKDKMRVTLVGIITVLVILTALLLAFTLLAKGRTIETILPFGIILLVALFMIPFVKQRLLDVRAGYPPEDERSKKILVHASAKAYTLSIWWMLALMWYTELSQDSTMPELIPRHVAGAGIVGMAILFGLSYLWTNWRGVAE